MCPVREGHHDGREKRKNTIDFSEEKNLELVALLKKPKK